jgi:hypothetical protein
MTMDSIKSAIGSSEGGHFLFDDWFDPLENGVRTRIRGFIEELLEAELDAALGAFAWKRLLIPIEGAHQNEMIAPAVTE